MPVTTIRSGLNTFPTSVTGGTIPDANRIIEVDDWAMALEPRRTPLLTRIYKNETVQQRPFYWGQSKRVAVETTTSTTHTNSVTTLSVATGTGVILQKYMMLEIINFASGSTTVLDPTRREIVWVSAEPSADTATIVRAQSGTSGIAHDSGAKVIVIGTAEPELQAHTIGPVTRGFQFYNYVQRFQEGVKADKAAQNMPTWEHRNNPMISDFEELQLKQKYLLEMAVWRGGRQAGDPSTPLPATMGGIDTFITTNVYNLATAKITPRLLETSLRDLAKNTEGGPEGIELFMSYNTAAIFDALIDPIRMATATDSTLSLTVESVKFRFGTFRITVSHNCFDNVIYGLRPSNLAVKPFKNMNWHVSQKRGEDHGSDTDEKYISGDFTLQVEKEASMFKLYNFNGNLDDYPSPFSS
jgi:hypothetical protein